MKNLSIEDLKSAVKQNMITVWSPRNCSICGCPLEYRFYENGDVVVFDGSCDCTIQHRNSKR